MTGRNGDRLAGWPALGTRPTLNFDPFADWYDAWRAQYSVRLAAEEIERARMRREICWMSGLIAEWSLVMGGAAAFAIWIVL